MPPRFWGPERIDAVAWEEFATRLDVAVEVALLTDAVANASPLLDVGAGSGLLSKALAAQAGRLVLVEPNPIIGRHLAGVRLDPPEVVRGRAEDLPFADRSFQAVVSTWVLQYTADPWASVREMARVCTRTADSCIVLVQAAPDNDLVTLYNACAAALHEPAAHHGYLLAGAAKILDASGFGDISLRRCPVPMDFRDVPSDERPAKIASLVRRLHYSRVLPNAVEPAIEAAARALPTTSTGVLRDDGVLLIARVAAATRAGSGAARLG